MDMLNKEESNSKNEEAQEKIDASLMYGALFTWLILQIMVFPAVSGRGHLTRACHPTNHAGKLDKNTGTNVVSPRM